MQDAKEGIFHQKAFNKEYKGKRNVYQALDVEMLSSRKYYSSEVAGKEKEGKRNTLEQQSEPRISGRIKIM